VGDRRSFLAASFASVVAVSALAPGASAADHPDAAILAAFEIYRGHWSGKAPVDVPRLGAAEDVLIGTPAKTFAGIEAKLRMLVEFHVSEKAMARQGLNAIGTPLVEHKQIDSFDERLLFHAAQDACRLAGGQA
jgi:hypothetical protein